MNTNQRGNLACRFTSLRIGPPPPPETVAAFQKSHQNEWLRQFRVDFANGFGKDRLNDAIARTDGGFRHLDRLLSDGRTYLEGPNFTLSDIAWMPNVHRFKLMDCLSCRAHGT